MQNATNAGTMTCDTDALNSLLRGELSAAETYDQAMKKIEDPTVLTDLQRIRGEHADAAARLRGQVTRFGGTPSESSGPWGAFTAAVTATAKLFGPGTALAALKQGEEHGINEYDDALKNEGVNAECKDMIRGDFLPRCRRHVADLDRLMGGMK